MGRILSLLEYLLDAPYLLATILAFLVSTTVNWILGRTFTFKDSAYQEKKVKKAFLVFLVSAIGLVFNLVLMYLLVDIIGMNTNLLKTVAKILARGLCSFGTFFPENTEFTGNEEFYSQVDKKRRIPI